MPKIEGPHREEAARLRKQGMEWPDIAKEIRKQWPDLLEGLSDEQSKQRVRQWVRQDEPEAKPAVNVQEALMKALTKGTTSKELADALGISDKMALLMIDEKKQAGYNVRDVQGVWKIARDLVPSDNRIKESWDGNRIIRFGIVSDPHICSNYTQLTHLHKTYDIFQREGIKKVYLPGDVTDGDKMRPGHEYELYAIGADGQVDEVERTYPKREGMETDFIIGNHDGSFIKLAGLDIGRKIAEARPDMHYLGRDSAVVELTDNCNMELRHPGDGTAYAISYKSQRLIDSMSGGEKPNLFIPGHYHKAEYIFYRNVHCIQAGCFQAQTPFLRGKGVSVSVGGYIVELHLNCDGGIERITQSFFAYYTSIKDDWKNWR